MRSLRLLSHLVLAVAASALIACGEDSPSGPDGDDDGEDPSITLSISPSSLTLTQGESGEFTATITRSGGFTGQVTVSVSSLPSGVTVESATIAGGSTEATLAVQASESASVGSTTATVQASGSGVSSVSQDLELEVEEGTPRFSLTFCEATDIPDWVALKDGDAEWTQVEATSGQTYDLEVTSDLVKVAYTATVGGVARTQIFHLSASELETLNERQCAGTGSLKTVNGSVADLGTNQQAVVSMGGAVDFAGTFQNDENTFTLEDVRDGEQDLVAGRFAVDLETGAISQDRLLIRRGLNPSDGATLDALDFDAEGFAPATAELTVDGVGADESVLVSGFFVTGRGTLGLYLTPQGGDTDPVQTYTGVPADHLEAGDLHYLQALVSAETAPGTSAGRMGIDLFTAVENRTMAVGPTLTDPKITVPTTSPSVLIRMQYALQSDYDRFWSIDYSQAEVGGSVVNISITDGWVGSADQLDVTIPDFSGVSGWQTEWGLEAGSSTTWSLTATGWSTSSGISQPVFEAGTSIRTAFKQAKITP